MNILVIHQYFLEKEGAGGSRFNQFAKYWSRAGNNVLVVSGTVDYASGKKLKNYKNRWINKEKIENNISVYRCFVSEQYNKSFLGRLWAYLSFTLSATWAILFHIKKIDIIIATSPPLFVAIPGYLAKLFKRAPLIFELRDLWPKFAVDAGVLKNSFVVKLGYRLENFIYKKADLINVLTPAYKEYLIKEKNVSENKIIYIPNAADLDIFRPGSRENWVRKKYEWNKKFVILYVGAHGVANDLWQIINVAQSLKNNQEILFILIGDGMEKSKLKITVQEKGLTNIQFLDSIPKDKLNDYINAADVCTAVLRPVFTTTYPNKVFDYMACAKPIILPIDGACRKLVVDEARAGIFVKPRDTEDFKEKIIYFYNHPEAREAMGQNGYRYVINYFDRQKLANQYLEIINKLATNQKNL